MESKIALPPDAQLVAALAKALPELDGVSKNKENAAFKNGGKVSRYADLGAVIEALEPIRQHGLWFRQHAHENENGAMVETFYIHESGGQLSAGCTFMPASKKDAQGFGSALTYCRRYALQTAFGLATEDDDGNAAVKAPPRKEAAQDDPKISNEQYDELTVLIEASKLSVAHFNQTMSCKTVRDLSASKFDEAVDRLKNRIAELARRETNREAADA